MYNTMRTFSTYQRFLQRDISGVHWDCNKLNIAVHVNITVRVRT